MRSSVDLPQPDGPISDTNSPAPDVEVDVLRARSSVAARDVERLVDARQADDRRAPG